MATIESHAEVGSLAGVRGFPVLATVIDWVSSADHKRTGRLMAGASVVVSIAVAAIGAVLSFERIDSDSSSLVDAAAAPQVLELFRYGSVLLLLAPVLLGIALAIVPLQVGSRAVSYGRLAQFGVWSWIFGATLTLIAILGNGGPGGGNPDLVDLHMLGLALTLAGLLAVALCLVVTVLTSRAPGMDLMDAPAFSWAALVGGFAVVVTFPVALGSIVYSHLLHTHGVPAADETMAMPIAVFPDWLFAQPTMLILAVLAVGVLAEVAPVTFKVRQPLRELVLVGLGVMTVAALTGVTQTQHVLDLDGSGPDAVKSAILWALFNGLPVLGILIVLAAVGLASKTGTIAVRGPLVAATLGVLVVLAGAAANAMQHVADLGLVGTAVGDGANALVVYGALASAIGAIGWWWPKWTGRTISDVQIAGLGGAAALGGLAVGAASIVAGFADQPASAIADFSYDGPSGLWNAVAALGHLLAALSLLGLVAQAVRSRGSDAAGDDPWDGHTLEWSTPSPAPADNFVELAMVGSPEPLLDVKPGRADGSKVGS
jgi:heme/copper-type cytochrome/quinol oxidase subunit 1